MQRRRPTYKSDDLEEFGGFVGSRKRKAVCLDSRVDDSREMLPLSTLDIECLEPGEYLTDRAIEFWMSWIESQMSPRMSMNTTFASPLFFSTLGLGLVDVEFRDLTFVPIHHVNHWSLAIAIRDESKIKTLLHLDSLSYSHHTKKVLMPLLDYLGNPELVRFGVANLPRQDNDYDCGLYMLMYIEKFSKENFVNFESYKMLVSRKKHERDSARREFTGGNALSRDWFDSDDVGMLRHRMMTTMKDVLA